MALTKFKIGARAHWLASERSVAVVQCEPNGDDLGVSKVAATHTNE